MVGFPKVEKKFDPAPEGLFQAVCVDYVDRGMIPGYQGKLQAKIDLFWELDKINENSGKPFRVMRRFTLSANEKSSLRKFLEAWRGKRFTDQEIAEFDFESLIGKNCQVQISHDIKPDGKVFDSIQAALPITDKMVAIRPSPDYVRFKDREGHTEKEPW